MEHSSALRLGNFSDSCVKPVGLNRWGRAFVSILRPSAGKMRQTPNGLLQSGCQIIHSDLTILLSILCSVFPCIPQFQKREAYKRSVSGISYRVEQLYRTKRLHLTGRPVTAVVLGDRVKGTVCSLWESTNTIMSYRGIIQYVLATPQQTIHSTWTDKCGDRFQTRSG
jgi:hypothetical protein